MTVNIHWITTLGKVILQALKTVYVMCAQHPHAPNGLSTRAPFTACRMFSMQTADLMQQSYA